MGVTECQPLSNLYPCAQACNLTRVIHTHLDIYTRFRRINEDTLKRAFALKHSKGKIRNKLPKDYIANSLKTFQVLRSQFSSCSQETRKNL